MYYILERFGRKVDCEVESPSSVLSLKAICQGLEAELLPGMNLVSEPDSRFHNQLWGAQTVVIWMLLLYTSLGCASEPQELHAQTRTESISCPAQALACVEGRPISKIDLERVASQLNPLLARQYSTRAGRVELLNALIERKLLEGEARRRGIHDRNDVRRQVRDFERRLTAKILAEELETAPPSESRMRAFFKKNAHDFIVPERFKTTRVALSARSAEEVRGVLLRGASASGINANGGSARLLEVTRSDVPSKTWKALHIALSGDRVTGPVKMGGGVFVLRIDEHRAEGKQTFKEAKSKIIERLAPAQRRLAIQALGQALRGQRDVEVRLENLD